MTREELSDEYPDLLVMDPKYLDDAIIGVVYRINTQAVCYSADKVVKLLMKHDGMSYQDAVEHMEYNMMGAWVGENTPMFLL